MLWQIQADTSDVNLGSNHEARVGLGQNFTVDDLPVYTYIVFMGIELIRENGFDLGLITVVTQKRLTDYGQLESKNAPERIMISPRSHIVYPMHKYPEPK